MEQHTINYMTCVPRSCDKLLVHVSRVG